MDRFFAALPVGRIVKRCNWSISTNGELFCLKGNHMSEAEMVAKERDEEGEEVDLKKTVLRCERQTLHRLPRTKALVFAFVGLSCVHGTLIKDVEADGGGRKRISIRFRSLEMKGVARCLLRLLMAWQRAVCRG